MTTHPTSGDGVARHDLQQTVLDLQAALTTSKAQLMDKAAELAQIRALMHQVTVYEGLVDVSPLVMMVSDLVQDHDALEGRIEQALLYCAGVHESVSTSVVTAALVHLLRGGSPVPDDISSLDG